jgi:hypothetical protein
MARLEGRFGKQDFRYMAEEGAYLGARSRPPRQRQDAVEG